MINFIFPKNSPLFYWTKLGESILKALGWFLCLAILFAIAPGLINKYKQNYFKPNSYETNIFLTISSSLLASAVLTATLSLAETKQRKKDAEVMLFDIKEESNRIIQNIRNTSTDVLLEELVGDKIIFDEISNLLIRQNFIRTNLNLKINLSWLKKNNNDKKFLLKKASLSYIIKNTSTSKNVNYNIKFIEELELDHEFPNSTKILSIYYQLDNQEPVILKGENLKENIIEECKSFPLLSFSKDVEIIPGGELRCCIKTVSIVESKLSYPFISNVCSKRIEIEIEEHPDDLAIQALLFHPQHDKLQTITNARHNKRWEVKGILPGQGVQINWKPKY